MSAPLDPFYPIVDSAAWVARLLPAGVGLIQLRIKNREEAEVRREVRAALRLCAGSGAVLVVNDYWRVAMEEGAEFVHLGQSDLYDADVGALRARGIRLGISTHDHAELDRALSFDPDYIALGPIYPTTLKVMPFAPQGLERIAEWKRAVDGLPLVAIGGVTLERAPLCLAAGADVVSVVSAIVAHPNPDARAAEWIAATREFR
jgi:thiamine-phosphate pyrophosphorylase